MNMGRYLPASRVQAGSCRLDDMCVKANDGRELGRLIGFVVDPGAHRIRSLVVESDARQLEVPMGPLQLDPRAQSLQMVDCPADAPTAFSLENTPVIEDAELWVPVFHSAA
jgi:hypothetical protein